MTATPEEFAAVRTIGTRWKDNDVYGHVNNVEYYSYFDTTINALLVEQGVLDSVRSAVIGVCAESRCRFLAAVSFPAEVRCGVRVARLGTSSATYELGLFGPDDVLLAEGTFTHVFVDRETRQPVPMPPSLRRALERLAEPAGTAS